MRLQGTGLVEHVSTGPEGIQAYYITSSESLANFYVEKCAPLG